MAITLLLPGQAERYAKTNFIYFGSTVMVVILFIFFKKPRTAFDFESVYINFLTI